MRVGNKSHSGVGLRLVLDRELGKQDGRFSSLATGQGTARLPAQTCVSAETPEVPVRIGGVASGLNASGARPSTVSTESWESREYRRCCNSHTLSS